MNHENLIKNQFIGVKNCLCLSRSDKLCSSKIWIKKLLTNVLFAAFSNLINIYRESKYISVHFTTLFVYGKVT